MPAHRRPRTHAQRRQLRLPAPGGGPGEGRGPAAPAVPMQPSAAPVGAHGPQPRPAVEAATALAGTEPGAAAAAAGGCDRQPGTAGVLEPDATAVIHVGPAPGPGAFPGGAVPAGRRRLAGTLAWLEVTLPGARSAPGTDPAPPATGGRSGAVDPPRRLPPPGTVAALGSLGISAPCRAARGSAGARRTMTPRQFAVTAAVAAGLALVLNAAALERSAETSPYGLRRSAALLVLRPLAAATHALALDRPRAALDAALGHDGSADSGSVTADSLPPPGAATGSLRPTAASSGGHGLRDRPPDRGGAAAPATAVQAASVLDAPPRQRFVTITAGRVPSTADPLRIWVGGDSVAGYLGLGVAERAGRSGLMAAHTHYQVSTGLTRPDYYDWPAHLEDDMRLYDPEVVVLLLGANDDQPIMTAAGSVADFGTGAWQAEYARRVAAVMDRLQAEHRLVVWVGQPVERAPDFDAHMRLISAIDRAEAVLHPGVVFVDSRPVLAGPDGGFSAYLPDAGGALTLMRAGDGVHLSPDGGRMLAGAVLERIQAALRADDEELPVRRGPW